MAWVHGGRYWQESIRVDGRVTSQSFGPDSELSRLAESLYRERRELRLERLRLEAENRIRIRARARALVGFRSVVNALVRVGLEAAGFHRPRRWVWRRRTVKTQIEAYTGGQEQAKEAAEQLCDRFAKCDRETPEGRREQKRLLGELRAIGERHPVAVIEATKGSIPEMCRRIYGMTELGSTPGLVWEGIWTELRRLEVELVGESRSPAVRLAAEAAVFAYLDFHLSQIAMAALYAQKAIPEIPPNVERHVSSAQRRYLRALKAVEEMRRLTTRRRLVMAAEL